MRYLSLAFLVPAVLLSAVAPAAADIPTSERDALIALYGSTNGSAWYDHTNWLGAAGSECTWFGVTCDAGGTTVTALDLESNHLVGPVPAAIGSLPNLEFLNLRGNNLSGPLPTSLGNLSSLLELDLGYGGGSITGPIPTTLGNLNALQLLDLSGQSLDGAIPTSITGLSNLVTLDLSSNSLSGGIPSTIDGLTSLQVLNLSYNPLGGTLPGELTHLTTLTTLYLSSLGLSGEIPSGLGALSNLVYLSLANNSLTGGIPPDLAGLANLLVLILYGNQLSGGIPPWLADLTSLGYLDLRSNQFQGTIPADLGSMSGLWNLTLADNELTGPIPPELGALSSLTTLNLSSNQLSGEIPAALAGLSSIYSLYLQDNHLSGPIPAALGTLGSLYYLRLSDNSLDGPLPSELGNLVNLRQLMINGNKITGEIPASFAGLGALYDNGSDFRWNALFTGDPELAAFLDTKQIDGNWQSTQTVAPEVVFSTTYPGAVVLSLVPITFSSGAGGYDVEMSAQPGGPYDTTGRLGSKAGGDIWLFFPNTLSDYYFHRARTWTAPHADNRNTVVSDWGDEGNFYISNSQFVLFVDPAGQPGNDCLTPPTACPDIASVFDLPYTGVRVYVAPGTYTENLTVTRRVELVGNDPATTIIDGGGLDRVIYHDWGALSLRNFTIRNGDATEGGGIEVYDEAVLKMVNCIVENNSASIGGGIHVGANATADLEDTVVRLNTSANEGAGIASQGGLWLDRCTIDGNHSDSNGGAGLSASGLDAFLWMSDTAVTGNTCNGSAGGLSNGGFAHIERSLVAGNEAIATPAISNATSYARMELINSTISGNTALGYNSTTAIYAVQPITMDSCTVTGNTGLGPDAPAISGGNMTVRGSIIAGNSPVNCSDPLISEGWNVEDADSCGFDGRGDQVSVDPLLDVLANNGGRTLTHALLGGSPAIDSGDPYLYPATDQRGVSRPDGGDPSPGALPDSGAFEVTAPLFVDDFESGDTTRWSVSVSS